MKMHQCLLSIIVLISICGCASVGRKIDATKVDQIKKGESTQADVRALVGAPDNVTRDGTGRTTWGYFFARSSVKGQSFIPIIGGFVGGANTQTQTLIVTFGPDGKVENFIDSHGGMESGSNLDAAGKAKQDDVEKEKRPK